MSSNTYKKLIEEFKVCDSNDHTIYAIPAKVLLQMSQDGDIKLWSHNRPPDEDRVTEIREYHKKTKHVKGMIQMAYIIGEGFVCYESNHRRCALIPEIQFVFVDVLWDVTQERVVEEFLAINQAVSVPSIYTEVDVDATVRNKIEEFVKGFCVRYKAFVSTSPNPHSPQFNRDNLKDNIYDLWKGLKCNVDDVLCAIERLNKEYENSPVKSERILKKCKDGGLWLFWNEKKLYKNEVAKHLHCTASDKA
jgi:hypothetical protein